MKRLQQSMMTITVNERFCKFCQIVCIAPLFIQYQIEEWKACCYVNMNKRSMQLDNVQCLYVNGQCLTYSF